MLQERALAATGLRRPGEASTVVTRAVRLEARYEHEFTGCPSRSIMQAPAFGVVAALLRARQPDFLSTPRSGASSRAEPRGRRRPVHRDGQRKLHAASSLKTGSLAGTGMVSPRPRATAAPTTRRTSTSVIARR